MVQEVSITGFPSRLICALLFSKNSEALGEHAGPSEELEERNGLLHDGGQHHRRDFCLDNEGQY